MDEDSSNPNEPITSPVHSGNKFLNNYFSGSETASEDQHGASGGGIGESGNTTRRSMLKLVGRSVGASVFATGLTSASDGPRHIQVSQPSDLCGVVPGDHHLGLIEDSSHKRGRGFYAGTSEGKWAFVGWLQQTQPSTTVSGSVTPGADASKPSHRLIQVWQPSDLKSYEPGDNHFALIEDPNHEHGRGLYAGASNGRWYFVGWLAQSGQDKTVSGSVDPKSGKFQPDQRLIQVSKPKKLSNYEPSDNHLAFIEDTNHEHGRGFYAGASNGSWYFIGWLAQSKPSGQASDTIDPASSECGSSGGDSTDDTTDSTTSNTFSNGAWRWYAKNVDEYETWLGSEIQVLATARGKNKWKNFIDFDTRDIPEWVQADSNRLFLPAIPMLPREEINDVGRATALRNLADGEYDDKFRSMAEGFAADGFTTDDIVLRVGNEFNIKPQPFSPVGTDVTAETWVEGYRRIVDVCRDVLGAELRTVWAPLVHTVQMTSDEVLTHYPGADYAMVGADIYDTAPAYEKPARAPDGIDYDTASEADRKTVQEYVWKETHLKGNKWGADGIGLTDIGNLSEKVGRPIVLPEWGLAYDDGKWGGGNNPFFVKKMHEWMSNHDVAFQAYYENDTPDTDHKLNGGEFDFADAATEYQVSFGGKSGDTGSDDSSSDDTTGGSSGNYVFVTGDRLKTQQKRVNNGEEPWASAYDNLMSDAKKYLGTGLLSVTDNGGGHDFYQSDTDAVEKMAKWARECGIAYWFTGEDKYAERVVEILHHWCLDDNNYMKPTTNVTGESITIYQHIYFPQLFFAASFVRGHAAWDNYDGSRPWDGGDSGNAESAFQQWVADRYDTFPDTQPYKSSDKLCEHNNKWPWRITDRLASASYLQDDNKVQYSADMFKALAEQCSSSTNVENRPWTDFVNVVTSNESYWGSGDPTKEAFFKKEMNRDEKSFGYHSFNLKAMLQACLIADTYDGTDLFGFNAPADSKSGSSIYKNAYWWAGWFKDPNAYENAGFNNDDKVPGYDVERGLIPFEIAYAKWGDAEFLDCVQNVSRGVGDRPHYGNRCMGHVTLLIGEK